MARYGPAGKWIRLSSMLPFPPSTGRISDVYERETSSAVMEFYVRETDWRDADGEPVVTDRFTLIVRRKPDAG